VRLGALDRVEHVAELAHDDTASWTSACNAGPKFGCPGPGVQPRQQRLVTPSRRSASASSMVATPRSARPRQRRHVRRRWRRGRPVGLDDGPSPGPTRRCSRSSRTLSAIASRSITASAAAEGVSESSVVCHGHITTADCPDDGAGCRQTLVGEGCNSSNGRGLQRVEVAQRGEVSSRRALARSAEKPPAPRRATS